MYQPPVAVDALEIIGGCERCALHQLDAQHARLILRHDGLRLGANDLWPLRILQDVAPAAKHGGTADDRRPAWMDTGDRLLIRPQFRKRGKVTGRESRIEGR